MARTFGWAGLAAALSAALFCAKHGEKNSNARSVAAAIERKKEMRE
jgi:hypothetical protein